MEQQFYAGVDHDENGGMTHLGRIVRDAWVFGILPETEKCVGWDASQMQNLYEKVYAAWEAYDHLPSHLPDDLRQRHGLIYDHAIKIAKSKGWDAELKDEE